MSLTGKRIFVVTDLPVWSMGRGNGAPSFYKTLALYCDLGCQVTLLTTECDLELSEFASLRIERIPALRHSNSSKFVSFLLRNLRFFYHQLHILLWGLFNYKTLKSADLLYGYEVQFIPSLRLLSRIYSIPFVSRFQGTILYPKLTQKNFRIKYLPHYLALKVNADLTIMTDDGTKGDLVLKALRGNTRNCHFLRNGLDILDLRVNETPLANDSALFSRNPTLSWFCAFRFKFLTCSRINKWKRLDRSIQVFARFHEMFPDSCLLVVGDGPDREAMVDYAENLGLKESIRFSSAVEYSSMPLYYRAADFFLSNYELSNLGNPLIEAMALGCIVVTLSNGTTGDIVVNGVNGFIVKEDDYMDNVDSIARLARLPDKKFAQLRSDISSRAVDAIIKNYVSWERRMKYEQVLVEAVLAAK